MVHSEIILLEIIKLYVNTSGNDVLELSLLEDAFYTFEEILGNNLGIPLDYVFDEELERLESICEGFITIDEKDMTFLDDDALELLEDQVLLALEDENMELDQCVPEFVYNIGLYKNLGIMPPIEDYQTILNTCFTIMKDYQLLAYQEAKNGKINLHLLSLIKVLKEKYQEIYAEFSHYDIFKIKVVLAYLNDLYLLDGDSDFINSAWYIILFSHDQNQFKSLGYERLFHSINEEEEDYEKIDEEEENNFFDDIEDIDSMSAIKETTYLDDEIKFFISYYTIVFNQTLKEIPFSDAFIDLMFKKYLLIAIQPEIEDYYLQNGSIDALKPPILKQEWINEQSFTSLYLVAAESVDSFNYRDGNITNQIYTDMITRALFIKSFCDLCGNKENIEDIKTRICNSTFYKNPNYSVATNIIDNIIFRAKGNELTLK